MRLVSRSERSQLNEARDAKARLHATITLAEDHLTHAENFTEQKKFDEASAEVGSYLGLIGDLRDYISKLNHDKTSTRDICRHLEMDVRPHLPRLAVMRRTTPASYSLYIKEAEEFIKDTRAEALDSFYGHSVLREPDPTNAPAAAGAKDSPQTKHP
jgi:chromosome segregation ATPase